jgi:hypothetical protein
LGRSKLYQSIVAEQREALLVAHHLAASKVAERRLEQQFAED